MTNDSYLKWLVNKTPTTWWDDSADPYEIRKGMDNGITGVTTNPLLINQVLRSNPEIWADVISGMPKELKHQERVEFLLEKVVTDLAAILKPVYEKTGGKLGYVCAQVNPAKAGDVETMISMARRFGKWAPNIAVKLPATAAGLEALEECAAEGITVTATVGFTVPQVIAAAERYRKGLNRVLKAGKTAGRCFAVLMVGRLDDYLRDVAMDRKAAIAESDIRLAGIAAAKRACSIYKEMGYEAVIMPAGMRGAYHAAELAGADMVLSIHPKIQAMISELVPPWEERIEIPVAPEVIRRLETIPEFVRAYEPEGMLPEEFITYGLVQKTLAQFVEGGWLPIESLVSKGDIPQQG